MSGHVDTSPDAEERGGGEDPLAQLAEGIRQIANGHFETRLDAWPDEPYRSIFADFNHMAEQLLGIESLRESFVSNVAHEFKTPLAYIQGYATLLQDADLTEKKRSDYSGHINTATRHLSNMIGNLLEIQNLSRPNAQLETEVFSLDEQLRHVMAMLLAQLERKGLDYDIDLVRVDIDGNESLLQDIWTNLITNAVKYTPSGGLIRIKLEKWRYEAIVRISDTGCGMTPNQARHAFDRFYQGDNSHVNEGSGLGLAIVKAVVKKHGGTVAVKSQLGHGTTFTVTLPLRQVR